MHLVRRSQTLVLPSNQVIKHILLHAHATSAHRPSNSTMIKPETRSHEYACKRKRCLAVPRLPMHTPDVYTRAYCQATTYCGRPGPGWCAAAGVESKGAGTFEDALGARYESDSTQHTKQAGREPAPLKSRPGAQACVLRRINKSSPALSCCGS